MHIDPGSKSSNDLKAHSLLNSETDIVKSLRQAKEGLKSILSLSVSDNLLPDFDIGVAHDKQGFHLRVRFYGAVSFEAVLPADMNGLRIVYIQQQEPGHAR